MIVLDLDWSDIRQLSAEHPLPPATLLVWVGVRYDRGAQSGLLGGMISGLPKKTLHRIGSLMRNEQCHGRCGLWKNSEHKNIIWQMSASE